MNDTTLATIETGITVADRGVELRSLTDFESFALKVVASRLAPKGFETPEAVLVAMQFGAEVGLSPMQALQSICIINGRPSLYGDAALAIVRASGLLEEFIEVVEPGKGEDGAYATCYALRKGYGAHEPTKFSVGDAKKAGLWGKSGPWTQYPKRMLKFRARGFELRDQFSDVLRGFKIAEEVGDYPTEKPVAREKVKLILPDETPPKLEDVKTQTPDEAAIEHREDLSLKQEKIW